MKLIVNNQEFNLVIANTFFKKLLGLMFKKEINEYLVFYHCSSVHTFFMKKDMINYDDVNEMASIGKKILKIL